MTIRGWIVVGLTTMLVIAAMSAFVYTSKELQAENQVRKYVEEQGGECLRGDDEDFLDHVTNVRLEDSALTDRDIDLMKTFTHLASLSLGERQFRLEALERLPKLYLLELSGVSLDEQEVNALLKCERFDRLFLRRKCIISDEDLPRLRNKYGPKFSVIDD